MAAILESPDLAPLVARHLHDVVDAVGLCAPRMPRMPALLAVSRRVRAAALPAYAEDGYLTFRAAVLAYTLVPHAAEGAELPLAWRVTLTTPLFPAGTTAAWNRNRKTPLSGRSVWSSINDCLPVAESRILVKCFRGAA